MTRTHRLLLMAGAASGLVAAAALAAPPGVTKGEFKCESGTATKMAAFIKKKARCVQRCLDATRETSGPYTDCFSPFGGETATCLLDPEFGAEARTAAALVTKCSLDCPECGSYPFGQCETGTLFVSGVSVALDAFSLLVYCTEFGAQTPTNAEAKCEDVVSKALTKMADARIECYNECYADAFVDQIPIENCVPPAIDVKTTECIAKAEAKALFKIDAACASAGGNPSCYGTGFDTGAEWVGLMGGAIDGQVLNVACGD